MRGAWACVAGWLADRDGPVAAILVGLLTFDAGLLLDSFSLSCTEMFGGGDAASAAVLSRSLTFSFLFFFLFSFFFSFLSFLSSRLSERA